MTGLHSHDASATGVLGQQRGQPAEDLVLAQRVQLEPPLLAVLAVVVRRVVLEAPLELA